MTRSKLERSQNLEKPQIAVLADLLRVTGHRSEATARQIDPRLYLRKHAHAKPMKSSYERRPLTRPSPPA